MSINCIVLLMGNWKNRYRSMSKEKNINGFKLEVCSSSPTSAMNAQEGGASRVELCQCLENGGITPSKGQIQLVRNKLDIGVHVLIRPRGGDFLYSDIEYEEMVLDIAYCNEIGVDGVVIGILTADGRVDVARTSALVELARPMTVVFHRAFDKCADPIQSLEDIINCGCDRLLTSGQETSAEGGASLIRKLVEQAQGRIEVMPGTGVNAANIVKILNETGARSIHSSAKVDIASGMEHRDDKSMGMDEAVLQTSVEKVKELVFALEGVGN